MAKYKTKPEEVEGFQITEVIHTFPDHVTGRPCEVLTTDIEIDSTYSIERLFKCDSAMTARMYPVAGDYIVIRKDGYTYLNPKKVFEDKFEKIEE